jgi:ABC-type ATPase involved in cell division
VCDRLVRSYTAEGIEVQALQGLDLVVESGELTALADEPTGQPGAETGRQIMRLLRAVVRSEGVTALVATHDPALIDIADEVLHLEDGRIAY